jgi:2-polyprenyl-3-methyl-5-hydroxy-6-metoxy-1,4-benzoquinol methylase
MAFDQTWEQIFKARGWGKYPSEDVIRFIAPRFKNTADRSKIRVLDLGCGGGAHTWFLAREGFDTFGIDGSASGIRQAEALLSREGLTATLAVGDFTHLDYPEAFFDVIIDSSAVQHNKFCDIRRIHEQIRQLLKPGGYFCGILINTETAGWEQAETLEENTLTNFQGGPIQQELLVHFFTEPEVRELMRGYEELNVEKTTRTVSNGKDRYGHFVVNGRKPLDSHGK